MTLSGKWYIGGLAKIHNPHINVLYIFCEVKFKFTGIYMLFSVHWLSMDKRKNFISPHRKLSNYTISHKLRIQYNKRSKREQTAGEDKTYQQIH